MPPNYKYIGLLVFAIGAVLIPIVAVSLSLTNSKSKNNHKFLINQDGGADDAMAIFMALLYEKHFNGPEVVGLVTTHGNVNEDQAFLNTQRILDIAKRRDYKYGKRLHVSSYHQAWSDQRPRAEAVHYRRHQADAAYYRGHHADAAYYRRHHADAAYYRRHHADAAHYRRHHADAAHYRRHHADAAHYRRHHADAAHYRRHHADAAHCRRHHADAAHCRRHHADAAHYRRHHADAAHYRRHHADAAYYRRHHADAAYYRRYHADAAHYRRHYTDAAYYRRHHADATNQANQIPIYRGTNSSLVYTIVSDYYYGTDGLGDSDFHTVFDPIVANPTHGVNALIELSKQYEGKLTIVSIGPVTNIAMAIRMDPKFLGRLEHLYIAAGHVRDANHPDPEFNALVDVEAYHVAVEHATPDKVTVIPFSQTNSSLSIPRKWRENVLGGLSTIFMEAMNSFEAVTIPLSETWSELDPAAMAVCLRSEVVREMKYSNNSIILCGEQRGINTNSIGEHEEGTNVRMVYSMVQDEFTKFLLQVFSNDA